MRGEISIINRIVEKREDNPIKKDLGKHSPLHIIAVINDEYWKEYKRKLESVPNSTILADNLGAWTITFSRFKAYIRGLIKEIRKVRKNLKRLQENPKFVNEESQTWVYLNTLNTKLAASWKQLEEQRKIFILRYLMYTSRRRKEIPDFQPKYDYTWFPYSFKKELLSNSKVDLNNIQEIE